MSATAIMQTTEKMVTLKWIYIICFLMSTPALSSSDKVLTKKDEGTYAPEKLSFGLGWSLGDIPSWIGLGSGSTTGFRGEGGSTDSGGQTSSNGLGYDSPGFSFGGGGGGGVRAYGGGNANPSFSFGGGGSGGVRNYGGGIGFGGGSSGFGGGSSGYGGAGGSKGIAAAAGDGRDYRSSSRPKDCHCTCDRTGGIGSKNNGQNDRNPPPKTVTCRPMNCPNNYGCEGYSKKPDSSPPYWCKVPGKGTRPFRCTNAGESSGKLLNCLPINCPNSGSCGVDGARYVLDIPIWMKMNGHGPHGSQSNGAYGQREPGYN